MVLDAGRRVQQNEGLGAPERQASRPSLETNVARGS
jgi:hypothetical protein